MIFDGATKTRRQGDKETRRRAHPPLILGGAGGVFLSPCLFVFAVAVPEQWFDTSRAWFGALLLGTCLAIVVCIALARAGWNMKLRQIAGLQAVDEAVGRATEMGRSCL